jgi:hypothetical protein
MDIFEAKIFCESCNKKMEPGLLSKNGFNLRILECKKCGEKIIHPEDRREYEDFMKLKKKDYEVKMRMVGNSYAVSIPREIVDFMKEQERMIDNMVKLSFEKAGQLNLNFNTPQAFENLDQNSRPNLSDSRTVSKREVRVVRDGKPVYHVQEFEDSAHPEKNKKRVFRAEENDGC